MDSRDNYWEKVKSTLHRLKDIEELKKEVASLAREIQTFDVESRLGPGAKKRLKEMEGKCQQLSKTISKAQKQFDREFNKSLRRVRKARQEVGKKITTLKKRAEQQMSDLTKASTLLQETLNKKKKAKKKKTKTVKKKMKAKNNAGKSTTKKKKKTTKSTSES